MTTRALHDRLLKRAKRADVTMSPALAVQLEQYLSFLARWNAKINLTAFNLREPTDEAIDRLLMEPVVAAQHIPSRATSVIDIGSGSGSPAIPLRLAVPDVRVTMVEAKTRKAVFLLEACRHLGLADAVVETARFEHLLTRPDMHEAFDVLTIRAVRVEVATLVTLQAFLKPGGLLFWFQGAGRELKPDLLVFPLVLSRVVPLADSVGGRLAILAKQSPSR